jgi:uncharacterized protein (TIGR00255 family)
MLSMSGWGVGEAPIGSGKIVLEARSLNHRYVEVRVNLGGDLVPHAFWLEQHARQVLERGRYDIAARLVGAKLAPPELDCERARTTFTALKQLRDELDPGADLPWWVVAQSTDLFRPASSDPTTVRDALAIALAAAVSSLDRMRALEGAALARDLAARLDEARAARTAIATRAPQLVDLGRQRLRERLERLLEGSSIPADPARLEAEVTFLADRSDVSEELARLDSHFDQLQAAIDPEAVEPVGRRIEFLLQEIGREANTIASKARDAPIAHEVVGLRTAIERMREQAANAL